MRTLSLPALLAALLTVSFASVPAIASASLGAAPSDFSNASAVRARQFSAVAPAAASATAGAGAGNVASYTVNETTLDSGTLVREYVGADGSVFAVSWNGPFLPDLRTLLGAQFATLTAENAVRAKGSRGQVRIARNDVVIESGGHMRAWVGRAWLVGALPAGFDTGAIQ